MAKVTEGSPYYYAPFVANSNILYVYKRGEHPHKEVVCKPTTRDNASLIVDALNLHHEMTTVSQEDQDAQKKYV